MPAILLLEDGRALNRANIGFQGMLELIAGEVSQANPRLRNGYWTKLIGRHHFVNLILED